MSRSEYALLFIVLCLTQSLRVASGDCGYPGRPTDSEMRSDVSHFAENVTVTYNCIGVNSVFIPRGPFRKTCIRGKWEGEDKRCGMDVSNYAGIKRIQAVDLQFNRYFFDILPDSSQQSVHPDNPLIVSFKSTLQSVSRKCVATRTDVPQLWVLKLMMPKVISYIELVFNGEDVDALNVTLFLSPYRDCRFVYKRHGGQETNVRYNILESFVDKFTAINMFGNLSESVLGFMCEMNTLNVTTVESYKYKYNYSQGTVKSINISMNSKSDVELFLCGIRLYRFSELKCGRSEIPFNGRVKYIENAVHYYCHENYELHCSSAEKCGPRFCSLDGQWVGEIPSCRPKLRCPLRVQKADDFDVTYDRLAYWNSSYVAVQGSLALYSCNSGRQLELRGYPMAICCNGSWDNQEPYCAPKESANYTRLQAKESDEKADSSLSKVSLGFAVGLIMGCILIISLRYQWKCISALFTRQKSRSRGEKIHLKENDVYESCYFPGDGGEPLYAEVVMRAVDDQEIVDQILVT